MKSIKLPVAEINASIILAGGVCANKLVKTSLKYVEMNEVQKRLGISMITSLIGASTGGLAALSLKRRDENPEISLPDIDFNKFLNKDEIDNKDSETEDEKKDYTVESILKGIDRLTKNIESQRKDTSSIIARQNEVLTLLKEEMDNLYKNTSAQFENVIEIKDQMDSLNKRISDMEKIVRDLTSADNEEK